VVVMVVVTILSEGAREPLSFIANIYNIDCKMSFNCNLNNKAILVTFPN